MCGSNRRIKLRLIEEQGLHCEKCSRLFDESSLTLHHVVPRAIFRQSNIFIPNNYMVVCKECHCAIHSRICVGSRIWCYVAERLPQIRSETRMANFVNDLKRSTILLKV